MSNDVTILVVDDAEGIRNYLESLLTIKGYKVTCAAGGAEALRAIAVGPAPGLVILDVMMPEMDGIETLKRIKLADSSIPVIMLSVVGKASTIVDAMNLGAVDYLNKPFEEEELEVAIKKVFDQVSLKKEIRDLRDKLDEKEDERAFIWVSQKMAKIKEILDQIAPTDITVLVQGESGVGKELIARAIHEGSARAKKPFVKVNCAALPEQLLESELFGYEKGAFTGASARKPGKFEFAHKGTIFLDEIGEMGVPIQAKLLQVLQDGVFSRLGGQRDIQVDVRALVATNRNLEKEVEQGNFREDLYYRLNVVNITVPPLRDRREEIPVLVEHFLCRYGKKYGKDLKPVSPALMERFMSYGWSGNVRELENVIKRLVVLENEASILDDLSKPDGRKTKPSPIAELIVEKETSQISPLKEISRQAALEAERETIQRVLGQTNWNRKKAAKILNISYKTLLQKIKECGLKGKD